MKSTTRKKNVTKCHYLDLSGQVFGELCVKRATEERKEGTVVWLCECSCGKQVKLSRRQLIRGYRVDCGHIKLASLNIRQQVFGKLKVIQPMTELGNQTKWLCQCDCGNQTIVYYYNLRNGHTQSCGCLKAVSPLTIVNGTAIELIKSTTVNSNNTSGFRGVSRCHNSSKWRADITFKGEQFHLGNFETREAAHEARQAAEKHFYSPLLSQYDNLPKF
ncbi:AP2 domain-containing protein [Vagococcus sp. BWB3-3]|uniref:AP2 domain-containing protein n=1 Tax=Vagococcus allomyrinae TaxID=2794353 RepID=A0A940P8B4_9ENTE|nr:AP2/ERF family transcription factor [Vagococcus allomyrinae]MBP1041536.1 AP2 domain-containing protein [Vagococcus allomyrinae]